MRSVLVGAAAASLLAGCASLPARPADTELASPPATAGPLSGYARRVEDAAGAARTAFWLLDRGELALDARLALTDEAVRTLDIQYFIWQNDSSSQLLALRVLDAANRGVKVRLLLDDFSVSFGRAFVARLDAHPMIEVRVFNPWAGRRSRIGIGLELLRRWELNPRMHNKAYIADGRFAIVGGRNIGDRYFGVYPPFAQDDLDVLLAGEAVAEVSASFDEFWNAARSYPFELFARGGGAPGAADVEARLEATVARHRDALAAFPSARADWSAFFEELLPKFAAGAADLLADSPDFDDADGRRVYPRVKALIAGAERDVMISSPYFIPDREFRALLASLVARGVRVRVLTNSLASNNHVVAHTGYKRWRRQVLRSGVELYELRADGAARGLYSTPPVASEKLGLHTKAVVVDGRRVFVGSPNVDPRSMDINTEIGVEVDSPELARRVAALMERDMSPENAWRVTLDADGWLTWTSGERSVGRQPALGFTQRAIEFLLNLLPLKKQA